VDAILKETQRNSKLGMNVGARPGRGNEALSERRSNQQLERDQREQIVISSYHRARCWTKTRISASYKTVSALRGICLHGHGSLRRL